MNGFLARVLDEKREELVRKRRERPAATLLHQARSVAGRDFRRALRRDASDRAQVRDSSGGSLAGGNSIIAEIKRRSPRVAAYRQQGPSEELARVYAASGASAISIVTDAQNFGTSLDDVARVRAAAALPVLVKDFIVDAYQVYEARAAGADALLLIARILDQAQLAELRALVEELGMTALVECHSPDDAQKALNAGATVVGINHRDLGSLETSLDTAGRLFEAVRHAPIKISESGLERRAQIEMLSALGFDAFLIGGALLDAEDPGRKLRELLGNNAVGGSRV
jgi:indole-3-glycerol phosphate synthase